MAKSTKEKILEAALEIFARDGYAETNLKDIAQAVGIVKSALYRHFESKEAIFNAVTDMMAEYYEKNMGSEEKLPDIPQSTDELYEMTLKMVNFTVHDRKIIQTRKILLSEQFRDEKIRDLADRYFLYGTEAMFTKIFSAMMDNGTIKRCDPEILAFSYTSPVTSLIHLCDRDPAKEKDAMEMLDRFIRCFIEQFGVNKSK